MDCRPPGRLELLLQTARSKDHASRLDQARRYGRWICYCLGCTKQVNPVSPQAGRGSSSPRRSASTPFVRRWRPIITIGNAKIWIPYAIREGDVRIAVRTAVRRIAVGEVVVGRGIRRADDGAGQQPLTDAPPPSPSAPSLRVPFLASPSPSTVPTLVYGNRGSFFRGRGFRKRRSFHGADEGGSARRKHSI